MNKCDRMGISKDWPKLKGVIQRSQKYPVNYQYDLQRIGEYTARGKKDPHNINATDYVTKLLGYYASNEVLIRAMQGKECWLNDLAKWSSYYQIGLKHRFFWHYQYGILWPNHPDGGLKMYSLKQAAEMMGITALLGWRDEVIYQGYMAMAALNRGYQLVLEYQEEHRRAQVFMLRLFSDWIGDVSHHWPEYAYDEPIYESLLADWRKSDPNELVPCLLAACDRHTHETGRDSLKKFYDFSEPAFMRVPIEILFLFRLREWEGLGNPVLDHPLMAPPFNQLPEPQPIPELDELMQAVLKRAREDWPNFDDVVSLREIKK